MADDMSLSGRTLPQKKAYYEYFRSAGDHKDGLILSLEEMGWLIGTGILFKSDADKVMNFFGKVAQGLEADCLKIIPAENPRLPEVPEVAINGKKFPDAVANVDLFFTNSARPITISYGARINSRSWLYLDREKYSGSDELKAFDLALNELSELSKSRLSQRGIETKIPNEKGESMLYSIDLNFFNTNNSEDAVNNIIANSEYIQKAVDATNRVRDMYKARIKTLAEKLIS